MTTKRKWQKSSPELIEKFLAATGKLEGIQPRKMFGFHCCFFQGNMFTGLHEENWILRLSEEDRETINTAVFSPMKTWGMKEYRLLSPEIVADKEKLQEWLERSLAYTRSLPAK